MTDNSPFDATGLSGFTVRTKLGAYTLGSVAAMHLRTPPAESDMVLEVEAGAFLVDTRLPEQDVSVFVNGHRVGEWLWRSDTPAYHEMSIPQEYFRGNELELEFRIRAAGFTGRIRAERGHEQVRDHHCQSAPDRGVALSRSSLGAPRNRRAPAMCRNRRPK